MAGTTKLVRMGRRPMKYVHRQERVRRVVIRFAWRQAMRLARGTDRATVCEYIRARRDLEGLTGRSAKELDLALG